MSTNRVEGAVDKGVGAVKEAAGKVTGNEELHAQGKADQTEADAKKAGENVKDVVKN